MSDNDTHPERPGQPWQPESPTPPSAGHPSASGPTAPVSGPGADRPAGEAAPGQPFASSPQPTSPYGPGQPYPGASQPGYPSAPTGYPASQPGQPGHSGYTGQPGYAGQVPGQPGYPTTGVPGYPTPTSGYPAQTSGYPYPGQPAEGQQPYPPDQPAPESYPAGGYAQPSAPPYAQGYPQQQYYGAQPAQPRRGGAGRAVATGLLALLLAGGGGVVGGLVVHAADDHGSDSSTSQPRGATQVLDRSSLAAMVANVKQSVVAITTGTGEGSGIVLNSDGYIVTNNHVVADAGKTVNVNFSDGSTVSAKVVGTDPRTDIGVVKVDNTKNLSPAKFGDSSALQVGDTVVAIGSPLGLEGSVTAGIVSALNRTIDESDDNGQRTGVAIAGAIQTDAAINPGNSGGALVNLAGQVVGINTAILTSGQGEGNIGVGFAIPGNRANEVAQAIIKGQKVSHPYLGASVGTAQGNAGAKVGGVTDGGPAQQAGIQVGDVITKAGSTTIHTSDDLLNIVQSGKVGDKLSLVVNRSGGTQNVTVTLGEAPPK
jgi:putative serine protease PepD